MESCTTLSNSQNSSQNGQQFLPKNSSSLVQTVFQKNVSNPESNPSTLLSGKQVQPRSPMPNIEIPAQPKQKEKDLKKPDADQEKEEAIESIMANKKVSREVAEAEYRFFS